MAEIDWRAFGAQVAERLEVEGLSYRAARGVMRHTNPSMLSRAVNGQALSAGNYLVICQALRLDPFVFIRTEPPPRRATLRSIRETLEKQAVAVPVSREAGAGA